MTPPLITITRPDLEARREIRDFASSVRNAAQSWPGYEAWSPTDPCDDRDARLRAQLDAVGWFDLADEPDAVAFVAAGGVELGRAAAPLDVVDGLLGRPLALGPDLARGATLGRYADAGANAWVCGLNGLASRRVTSATPVGYLDSVGAALLELDEEVPENAADGSPSQDRVKAWTAATAGYASGLTAALHEMATTHARERAAFGGVIADLDVVAAKLADTAMASEGLLMALEDTTGPELARHAVETATIVSKTSQQIHGGLGFTLEFPLQRFSRRAWALESWTLAVLEPMTGELRWIR